MPLANYIIKLKLHPVYSFYVHCQAFSGTSLVVQWLGFHAPSTGVLGSSPDQGTRSHMLQLRVHMPQLKILRAATKTRHSQINYFLKKE